MELSVFREKTVTKNMLVAGRTTQVDEITREQQDDNLRSEWVEL